MNFNDEINRLESLEFSEDYIIKKGSIPILFTAPHTMEQVSGDGVKKLSEPYTKAIALYLNKYFDVNAIVKINDTGSDSNKDNRDEFKKELIRFVKDNNIRLVIDLHGSSIDRDFDVEFGTMNNLSADYSTVKELSEAFTENGITNVKYNDPFKGGAITQYLYGIQDVDVIQIEINRRFRDYNNLDNINKLCNCFEKFIKQYNKYINK